MVALYQNLMDRKEGFDMGIGKIFSSFQTDISPVFYSVLARSGYFPVSELATFLNKCKTARTPLTTVYGIRIASGSLGQGMSVGIELLKLKN
jgi:transketolase